MAVENHRKSLRRHISQLSVFKSNLSHSLICAHSSVKLCGGPDLRRVAAESSECICGHNESSPEPGTESSIPEVLQLFISQRNLLPTPGTPPPATNFIEVRVCFVFSVQENLPQLI